MHRGLTALWMSLACCLALAMPCSRAHADAAVLRAEARQATEEGRLTDAFRALLAAREESNDPALLLELAEAADHLRVDDVALASYRAFLEAAPDAPRHREIAGRVDALERLRAGHAFGAARPRTTLNYVVDWQGRPITNRPRAGAPSSELVSWDGSPLGRTRPASSGPQRLAAQLARPY